MTMLPRPSRFLIIAASLAGAAVLGAGVGAGTYAVFDDPATSQVVRDVDRGDAASATTSGLSVSDVYRRVADGVVTVTAVSAGGDGPLPFDAERPRRAQASGFVYDEQGHIVTNQHVIDGATSVTVRFPNDATHEATVVGSDASTDLAVLEVDAPASLLEPLALGNSADLEVGDGVVAIGSPFGLDATVTTGIVSALNRRMTSPNNFTIDGTIQTDAAINHGNSGGPLLDLRGRVVGVNSQIESESGGNDGVGFAVPSNTVKSVVSQIVETGEVEHAYLGVAVASVPADIAERLNIAAGAAVTEVRPGTPAARAGLRAATGSRTLDGESYPTGGDVITAVDGDEIASADELTALIGRKRPGDDVTLTTVRNGETRTIEVALAERPS
jgi:S1-C subfamily serine protease